MGKSPRVSGTTSGAVSRDITAKRFETAQGAARPQGLKRVVETQGQTERKIAWKGRKSNFVVIDSKRNRVIYVEQAATKKNPGIAYEYKARTPRNDLQWYGDFNVVNKLKDPAWTIPPGMKKRNKALRNIKRVPGGSPYNPLGHYVVYLNRPYIRVHCSPGKTGVAQSNGCIGLSHQDAQRFYGRVKLGTKGVKI